MEDNKKKEGIIGTHNGTFHCDEVLACSLLKYSNKFNNYKIIRSRDMNILNKCDIIVDVGGVYDPNIHRYDHHQRTFNETFDKNHIIKLSSAGLIFKHFGHEIIKNITNEINNDIIELLYQKMYDEFIMPLDAIDNGINQYPNLKDQQPLYRIRTDLSSRVGQLNCKWNEKSDENTIRERFNNAMLLTEKEFKDTLMSLYTSWLPGKQIVENGVNNRYNIHKSGAILKFDQFAPWKGHLHDIEIEKNLGDSIKYVLYTDYSNKWRIQCVPLVPGSFENRLSLPESWRGLRDEKLSEHINIPNCTFVHASGFIGGNETYDGVLKMAEQALAQISNRKRNRDDDDE